MALDPRADYDKHVLEDSRASGGRPLEREVGNRPGDEADASPSASDERPSGPGWFSRTLEDRRIVRTAAVTAVLLVVAALLWMAGELHYQSCLQKADVKSPGLDSLSRLVRQRDVERCSRLPF